MFWENSQDCKNAAVAGSMSRNQFESILTNLHLADNDNLEKSDKFAKVRPFFHYLNEKCKENFVQQQTVSIDEAMVPYYGKHGARQFMHGKPIKFGYKVWMAATPTGYVIAFYPYQGKQALQKTEPLGESVVFNLLNELPGKDLLHYHLVFDNFFTSIPLLANLAKRGIAATGTLRENRDLKAPLKPSKEMKKDPRGTCHTVLEKTDNICVSRWKDNKVVTVASTFDGALPMGTTTRFLRAERKRATVPIPRLIQTYNTGMGGVDRVDQNLSCYMTNIRSKKW